MENEKIDQLKKALLLTLGDGDRTDIDYDLIANRFTDFLKANMPPGVAVCFGFAGARDKIMCVVGGQHQDSPAFDAIITKLASQVDQRRDFEIRSEEINIGRANDDENT